MPFFLFDPEYYKIKEATGLSQAQEMTAYLGGSMFQTVMDNPVTVRYPSCPVPAVAARPHSHCFPCDLRRRTASWCSSTPRTSTAK